MNKVNRSVCIFEYIHISIRERAFVFCKLIATWIVVML